MNIAPALPPWVRGTIAVGLLIPISLHASRRADSAEDGVESQVDTIAGQTMAKVVAELSSENRVIRTRAARTLGAFGASAGEPLREALDHSDPAVRYLAAVSLGRLGGPELAEAEESIDRVFRHDSLPAVRMAAAFARCALDRQVAAAVDSKPLGEAIRFLVKQLASEDRATVCSACELLGFLQEAAQPASAELRRLVTANEKRGGDYHLVGAAKNALRKITAVDAPAVATP